MTILPVHRFTDETTKAPKGKKAAVRALQAWQFLIAKASRREIIRYEHLRLVMGYRNDRPLSTILGHVMHLCSEWRLPPLTIIVVNQDGTPGPGFTEVPRAEFDQERERVYDQDWFSIVPPSIEQFHQAWVNAHGGPPPDEEV